MSAPQSRRPVAEMSLAEKLACEREARHDVLARGRAGDAEALQHYLAHVRGEDLRHPRTGARAAPSARPRRDPATSSALRHWLRWGEEGRSGAPVIPPG